MELRNSGAAVGGTLYIVELTAVMLNKLEPAFVYSICSAWAYVDTEGFRRESVSQS
jgi:hypothetical protein